MKNYRAAIADCEAVIRLSPQSAAAYGLRGEAKFGLKDYKGAIADFDQALARDSVTLYRYFRNRSVAKYSLMDYAGSKRDAERAEYFRRQSASGQNVSAPATAPTVPRPPLPKPATPAAPASSAPAVSTAQPKASATPIVSTDPKPVTTTPVVFKSEWLDQYKKDSVFTPLKLSRAIATQPDKGPLYAARGLIARYRGRMEDACADFHTAREAGYVQAEDMLKAYCK
jgi:tetratricopeptide (TPR) repeat protein